MYRRHAHLFEIDLHSHAQNVTKSCNCYDIVCNYAVLNSSVGHFFWHCCSL